MEWGGVREAWIVREPVGVVVALRVREGDAVGVRLRVPLLDNEALGDGVADTLDDGDGDAVDTGVGAGLLEGDAGATEGSGVVEAEGE